MIRIDVEGGVKCHLEIQERDIKTWEPERIAQFFRGIAEAIQAINRTDPEVPEVKK